MKMLWPIVSVSLVAAVGAQKPTSAQKPTGVGIVTGTIITGVTPEDRQIDDRAQIFLEVNDQGKTWRYPTRIARSCPGHFFHLDCKAKGLPTGMVLSRLKLIILEPGKPVPLVCTARNFDGRIVLFASPRASVVVDGVRRRVTRPLCEADIDKQKACPTGLKSISGLHFTAEGLK